MIGPDLNLVFCYGTLKKGFPNNDLLNSSLYLGSTVTGPHWDMFAVHNTGGYPVVVEGFNKISGDLYAVDEYTMYQLDKLESNGYLYDREQIPLPQYNCMAWMFVWLCQYDTSNKYPWVQKQNGVLTWTQQAKAIYQRVEKLSEEYA